jgi:hypothetical protein
MKIVINIAMSMALSSMSVFAETDWQKDLTL